ncbi:MAG: hypothetical protein R3E97_08545 [Candidatus Eisenbacteria bacterium]
MGEGILKDRIEKAGLGDRVRVRSAGTWADFRWAASENGVTVAAEDDIDIAEHRSHPITSELIEGSHLVLVMTPEHRVEILADYPDAAGRVHVLTKFADEVNGSPDGVADPIGGNLAAYRKTYMELTGLIDAAMPRILQLIEEETAP